MNEEIKKNEISEDELEAVSGGSCKDNIWGTYYDETYCPVCGNRLSVTWDERDGVEFVSYHYCRKCAWRD